MATSSRSKDLEKMVAKLLSDNISSQLEYTIKFKKFLSSERSHIYAPIDEVILSQAVTRFMEFLEEQDFPELQYEAACALTNIVCENAKVVIDEGAVPILVQLLASPKHHIHEDVREQTIWALRNVVNDSIESRDYVLSCGVLMPLLLQLNEDTRLSVRRAATKTLANLCRNQPPLPLDQEKLVLAALEKVVGTDDEELLRYACWTLFYVSYYGSEDGIQNVTGLVPRLVQLIKHTSLKVIVPSLRTIANIAAGDNQKTQCVINSGALPILANMLTQDCDKRIKKNVCWTISNITAGTQEQIQSVINENLIPTLVNVAQYADLETKKEALWAISNAVLAGSLVQIMYLVVQKCIKPLCDNLLCPDPITISLCLNGLENILMAGEAERKHKREVNYYSLLIEDAKGLEKIENLQRHEKNEIKKKAMKILASYYYRPTK